MMDAWQKLLIDEEERDLFFVGEELHEMQNTNFVKLGTYTVNLSNVTEMHAVTDEQRVIISFAGSDDNYIVIRKSQAPEAFSALMTWMDEQPALLSDEE